MKKISYAQNREDVILFRAFGQQSEGFYIDVGANDPTNCSVTHLFSDCGWRGINIEPVPAMYKRLCAARPRDVNLNVGISNRVGTLPFFEVEGVSTLSTFSAENARAMREKGVAVHERDMPILTLAEVCQRHVTGPIDFLSIDAEDHELEVIQGADWSRWRPRVVLIEDGSGRSRMPMLAAGYLPAIFDGVNRFFVRKEDEHLLPILSVPANCLDGFGAGCGGGDIGPTSLAIARRMHQIGQRFPRTAALAKWMLHAIGNRLFRHAT